MRDLNFFDPYLEKREFKLDKMFFFYLIISIGILYLAVTGIFNGLKIGKLKQEVSSLQLIAENPQTLAKVAEIQTQEEELNIFREEVSKIKVLNEILAAGNVIDENLLLVITSKMPDDVFFTNFSAAAREIQIAGISKSKYSIAELSKGLEGIENVEDIFISNITAEEDFYRFSLNITLEDVMIVGEEIEEQQTN